MPSAAFALEKSIALQALQAHVNQRQNTYGGALIALCVAPDDSTNLFVLEESDAVAPSVTLAVVPAPDAPVPAGKTLICTGFIYIANRQSLVAAYTG